jgi:hypothetical protein
LEEVSKRGSEVLRDFSENDEPVSVDLRECSGVLGSEDLVLGSGVSPPKPPFSLRMVRL